MIKKILILILFYVSCFLPTYGYILGFKSFDNTVDNIVEIEKKYWVSFPIASFIFDPREQNNVPEKMKEIKTKLWPQKIYHISISPNSYTAEEVANGAFDLQYLTFFHQIKELNLKVIFRTMHEMNWGRYPRSSNPETFKKAWIHVRNLSREAGLNKNDILFDMSINARDLPAKWGTPSQTATFIECDPKSKQKLKCASFEDYYPGEKYVDLMGVTFYNRGKGNSNRRRWTPDKIINNPKWNTLTRIKKLNKPIFVDEVATTAVNYPENYNYQRSLDIYQSRTDLKDAWILQLRDFLQRETQIVGAIYFNVDLTNGLQHQIIGELDRALINLAKDKFYNSFRDLYNSSNFKIHKLLDLFDIQQVKHNSSQQYLPNELAAEINRIQTLVEKKSQSETEKKEIYKKLSQIQNMGPLYDQALSYLLSEPSSGDTKTNLTLSWTIISQ